MTKSTVLTALIMCSLVLSLRNNVIGEGLVKGKKIVINHRAILPDNPRTHYARSVNDAPDGGEAVTLNPPRLRWKYHLDGNRGDLYQFVFQISASRSFESNIIDVTTPYNFRIP